MGHSLIQHNPLVPIILDVISIPMFFNHRFYNRTGTQCSTLTASSMTLCTWRWSGMSMKKRITGSLPDGRIAHRSPCVATAHPRHPMTPLYGRPVDHARVWWLYAHDTCKAQRHNAP
jgi:hypothetical protein